VAKEGLGESEHWDELLGRTEAPLLGMNGSHLGGKLSISSDEFLFAV